MDQDTAYVVTYTNQWPDDGFELGGVYKDYDKAQEAANNREHCDMGWEYAGVRECPFHD